MITLYSTHCPKCNVLKAKLDQAGINYFEENDVKKMTKKGFLSAPMLEVDGNVMNFKESMEWIGVVGNSTKCEDCVIGR